MATIRSAKTKMSKLFDGFSGLGARTPLDGKGAAAMKNFRVRTNGRLDSRTGYRPLATLPGGSVRGFWEGTVGGVLYRVAAAGDQLYRLDPHSLAATVVGSLPTSAGPVRFFAFENGLYLADGEALQVFDTITNQFTAVIPYVPLYGFEWPPLGNGIVKEPLNLLTNSLRVHFISTTATHFYLPFYAQKIDCVLLDDSPTSNYTLSEDGKYIVIPEAKSATTAEVAYTALFGNDVIEHISASAVPYVHEGALSQRLFLGGAEGDHHVYCSSAVTSPMLEGCRACYGNAKPLYFKDADVFHIGSRDDPVSAFHPHYGAVLAMNRAQAWVLQEEDGIMEDRPVPEAVGAVRQEAVTSYQNKTLVLNRGSIQSLTSPATQPENLKTDALTLPFENFITSSLYEHGILFWNAAEEELWVRDTTDPDGTVWIYHPESKEWYTFDNIHANLFFSCAEGIGFGTPEGKLFILDSDLHTDDGYPICCMYETSELAMDEHGTQMRALTLSLTATIADSPTDVCVTCDKKQRSFSLPYGKDGIRRFDLRLAPGRSRFLRCRITAMATKPVTLFRLALHACA